MDRFASRLMIGVIAAAAMLGGCSNPAGSSSTTTDTFNGTTESARVGSVLSGSIGTGSYCVTVYDVGNVSATESYTVTVAHP
jgi:hypothetical protein